MKQLIKLKLLILCAMLLCAISILLMILSFSFSDNNFGLNGNKNYGWCALIDGEAIEPLNFDSELEEIKFKNGEKLWVSNCAPCHKINADLIGPALAGITYKYEREWLYNWIKNNQVMVKSGDVLAIKAAAYNTSVMTAFPMLTNQQIDDILFYIDFNK